MWFIVRQEAASLLYAFRATECETEDTCPPFSFVRVCGFRGSVYCCVFSMQHAISYSMFTMPFRIVAGWRCVTHDGGVSTAAAANIHDDCYRIRSVCTQQWQLHDFNSTFSIFISTIEYWTEIQKRISSFDEVVDYCCHAMHGIVQSIHNAFHSMHATTFHSTHRAIETFPNDNVCKYVVRERCDIYTALALHSTKLSTAHATCHIHTHIYARA